MDEKTQAWVTLVLAGALEICWAAGLKHTEGFTRLWPSAWTICCLIASLYLLALSVRTLPMGTAYAVWTGIGAAGTAIVGILLYKEPTGAARLVSIFLIIAGTLGLKFFGGAR